MFVFKCLHTSVELNSSMISLSSVSGEFETFNVDWDTNFFFNRRLADLVSPSNSDVVVLFVEIFSTSFIAGSSTGIADCFSLILFTNKEYEQSADGL